MQATINFIRESLAEIYPQQEITSFTKMILEEVSKLPMAMILCDKSKKITAEQRTLVDKIVDRLKNHEPIQYIFGYTEFYGLQFDVNKNVLIPRPETEELVEIIVANCKKSHSAILDIGTGSGCIAISLKANINNASVSAWDVSEEALLTAKENALKNKQDITFSHIDVLQEIPKNQKFDIIVSNPPYVLESEKLQMENNVLEHEPHLALFVDDNNPLLFYNRIADIARKLLNKDGLLYFEINSMKGQETVDMLKNKGYQNIELIKDLSGKDRITKASI